MNSVTLIYEQAQEIVADKRPTVVLYIGDLDEWGGKIEDRVADDLKAFVHDLGGESFRFETIALTTGQAQIHGLPENPEKPGEYQAEALPPDVLARIVRTAAEAEIDLMAIKIVRAAERTERKAILGLLDSLGG